MATKGKESPSPKEKRVTSPPYARKTNTSQQRKSLNTSKQCSPVTRHDATISEKHIPNYLKPTICSSLDLSINQLKKNALSDSKSKITRRKSFDKPLLPSPVHKTRTSPNPKERSIRSSSFTARYIISQKPVPDRLLKSPKDYGEGRTSYGRPITMKKTNTNVKKHEKETSATPKEQKPSVNSGGDDPTDIDITLKDEPRHGDVDTPITQADEEVLNVVDENELATEDLVLEDYQSMDLPYYEGGSPEVEEVMMVESSTKGEDESVASQMEKQEEILEIGESTESHSELKEDISVDNNGSILSDAKVEDEEIGKLKPNEVVTGQEIIEKDEGSEGSIEDAQLQETENAKDDAAEIVQDIKSEESKEQVTEGKKDSTISNDVIVETATKLREQKKNKVKALAGAFETVISLQEPK